MAFPPSARLVLWTYSRRASPSENRFCRVHPSFLPSPPSQLSPTPQARNHSSLQAQGKGREGEKGRAGWRGQVAVPEAVGFLSSRFYPRLLSSCSSVYPLSRIRALISHRSDPVGSDFVMRLRNSSPVILSPSFSSLRRLSSTCPLVVEPHDRLPRRPNPAVHVSPSWTRPTPQVISSVSTSHWLASVPLFSSPPS